MAQSTTSTSRKIWRTVLTGAAAVPFAVFAAAPAVGAVETEPAATANVEQLPPVPAPVPPTVPDPTLLLELQTCLADLQEAVGTTAPAPAAGGQAEQAPVPPPPVPAPPTQAPDLAALVETCQTVLETVQGTAPQAEDPVAPKPQEPVG